MFSASTLPDNIDDVLRKLSIEDRRQVESIFYGPDIQILDFSQELKENNLDLAGYKIPCNVEQLRDPRVIRIGAFQHKLPLPPAVPIKDQRHALFEMAKETVALASLRKLIFFVLQRLGVNMPFAFCTKVKQPWCEYAESAEFGPTTKFVQELAKRHNMVMISPIFERDELYNDRMWNTAVVIDNHGCILGKHRKNHVPRVTEFSEAMYYVEGDTGHPVFETEFGKIAVNICYGRHHPLNWLMFGINGAEIVFNPSATIGETGESIWGTESRTAGFTNGYFTVNVNRVGGELYPLELTSLKGMSGEKQFGYFYGSSFVTAPNGSRTPSLSRTRPGLHVTEIDLNLCRQAKDFWGLQMTGRLEMYAKKISQAVQPGFVPELIRKK